MENNLHQITTVPAASGAARVEELIDAIIEARKKKLSAKIKRSPRNNPILSDISDCDRQIVYGVLDWQERPLHDENLQALFEEGNKQERGVIGELYDLGFEVILSQEPVVIDGKDVAGNKVKLATGRIDGAIRWRGVQFPLEIKFMNQNVFNQIQSIQDFQKKPHLRKYMRQLPLYLYGKNKEQGFFLIVDGRGNWKLLPVFLDYGTCEFLLKRLENVNRHLQARTYPDRIVYDQSVCGKCPFAVKCLPDIVNKGADVIDNPEFEEAIARHEELRPLAGEYDDLHDKIKKSTKGIQKILVGTRWMIQNVPSERTTYDLPPEAEEQIDEIKKQHVKKIPVTRLLILDLEKKQTEAA